MNFHCEQQKVPHLIEIQMLDVFQHQQFSQLVAVSDIICQIFIFRTIADDQVSKSTQCICLCAKVWITLREHVPVRPASQKIYLNRPGLRQLQHVALNVVLSLPGTKLALSSVPPFYWVKVCPMRSLCWCPPLPLQFSQVGDFWCLQIPPPVRINRFNADVVITG